MTLFKNRKKRTKAEKPEIRIEPSSKPEEENGTPEGAIRVQTVTDSRGRMDIPFLILTLLLTAIGLIMLFSASYARSYQNESNSAYYFTNQALFAAGGLVAMFLASYFKYTWLYRLGKYVLAGSVLLLILVLVMGTAKNGAKRWIYLGFTSFQPSEIAKLGVVLMFASMMSAFQEKMDTFRYGVLPFGLILIIVSALLLLEPHLSATIIILLLGAVMMFAGGTKLRWFGIGLALVALGLYIYLSRAGYANARITAWLDPQSDPSDTGYQIIQSLNAIGSGGFLGKGFGMSRQKYLYLPEEHNDYIFAIVCEELGFVGAIAILLLFVLLICRGYWIAIHAQDRFGMLVAVGLTTLLALQVFLNIGVVTNFLPATGISLPFFSYGGTALMMQLGEMGIILNISRWGTDKLKVEKAET